MTVPRNNIFKKSFKEIRHQKMSLPKLPNDLAGIKEYLQSSANEDAKRPLIYPFFKNLFGDKFKIESAAEGADTYIAGALQISVQGKRRASLDGR